MSDHVPFDAQKILNNGWRQGEILPEQSRESIEKQIESFCNNSEALAIVVSQDCDIVHGQLENEPFIEVLTVFPIDSLNGNLTCGKNPRKYHLSICEKQTQKIKYFEAFIHHRVFLDRSCFMQWKPNVLWTLEASDKKEISKWLAQRYLRAAFPNEFNRRIKSKSKKIRNLLKNEARKLEAIYIFCPDEELPENISYELRILGRISEKTNANIKEREAAIKTVNDLAKLFLQCDAMTIDDCDCRCESDISLADLNEMKRWSVNDDLSYGEQSQIE